MNPITKALIHWLTNINTFSRLVLEKPLRKYQLEPASAILKSILEGQGLTFVVMMARQAGKNELSGQLEAYLLNLYRRTGGSVVKGSPTFKPQTVNSILRLEDRLKNPWNAKQFKKREGYIVQLDKARVFFFSADPAASVVGATASLLLEGDEAQDIKQTKWDKDFAPMGASTNTTTVFYGTAWTSNTFLAQRMAYCQQLQQRDGIRRVFTYAADQVTAEVPAYGRFVKAQEELLGNDHPLIKTQYHLLTIDSEGGLFPPLTQALMHGNHPRRHDPEPGHRYALIIDVAGEDETAGTEIQRMLLTNPKRDATSLTVIDVDLTEGPLPRYRAVDRKLWLGVKHESLYAQILALVAHWHAVYVVPDETGVGLGLTSFLVAALGEKVIPVEFSGTVKSDIGWGFLAIVGTGRYKDYTDDQAPDTRQFWYEVGACQYEVRPGPGHLIRWGVWETPTYDGLIATGHDDALMSAAMVQVLDGVEWPGRALGGAVARPDPLAGIDDAAW